MIYLALLGKDIQHSLSAEIYKKLIPEKFQYNLLDYSSPTMIPSAESLLEKFLAINITSPYKKYFLDQISNTQEFFSLNSINLIYKKGKHVMGANTDYLALLEIVSTGFLRQYETIIIIGSGSMADVFRYILERNALPCHQFSRSNTENLDKLDLSMYKNSLVINCCSRSFLFNGKLAKDSLFWNMNYAHIEQESLIKSLGCPYRDGLELLEKQAAHAVKLFLL